jgi:hypothetical protein
MSDKKLEERKEVIGSGKLGGHFLVSGNEITLRSGRNKSQYSEHQSL